METNIESPRGEMSVSPVAAAAGGCSTSLCTPQQEGSALHNFDGTSHPGSS